MLSNKIKKVKEFFKRFFSIDDTPHKIAAGAAVGFFLGIVPGEGVIATLVVVSILKLNRVAALAGVLATNMWMTIVVLPAAAFVGGFIFRQDPGELAATFNQSHQLGWKFFLSKIILWEVALPLIVGFFVVAGALSLGFYLLLLFLIRQKKIRLK
jgi:uncharacterized protein (DUF2062 family)